MKENSTELIEKLAKFPYITKYYGPHLNSLDKSHPLIRHLMDDYSLFEFSLNKMNMMLEKLDDWKDIPKIVRESKNPPQFFDTLSELKVAAELIDRVNYIRKLHTPDFEIQIDNKVITLEVKRIRDKLGNSSDNENNSNDSQYAQIVDDIKTIIGDSENSILERHQYREGIPHILIFDCSLLMGSVDFEDSLYLKQNEPIFKDHGKKGKKVKNEKLFYQKDDAGNNVYLCLSGIIGIFDFQSISTIPDINQISITKPQWIFYENPFSDPEVKITNEILGHLKLKKFNGLNLQQLH
jgi:hypothetical protein